ncbi:uncharacterized protein FFFS_15997 [Fusarium fujikuroi]|nr:uncharacterized protein FFFS_15997 [Fusarium fujikuroi]
MRSSPGPVSQLMLNINNHSDWRSDLPLFHKGAD